MICDEAHKMSAHYFGNEVKETKRYKLGKRLGEVTRHLLLMTATPHCGKPEDFELFMALLDYDRFAGKVRGKKGQSKEAGARDMMRRLVQGAAAPHGRAAAVPRAPRLRRQVRALRRRGLPLQRGHRPTCARR